MARFRLFLPVLLLLLPHVPSIRADVAEGAGQSLRQRWTSDVAQIVNGEAADHASGRGHSPHYTSFGTEGHVAEESDNTQRATNGNKEQSETTSGNAPRGEGCILYMDNRGLKIRSAAESPNSYLETRGKDLPYWISSKIINKLYAQRHGYKFVVSSSSEFASKAQPRAPAWYKVRYLQQQLRCCCQWALFLDSDAYLRMDDHSLSMDQWLRKLTIPNYFDAIQHPNIDMKYQSWFPESPTHMLDPPESDTQLIGLLPRNGHSNCFFPEIPGACLDFVNTGVVLLRNSSLTHEFLDEWYDDQTPGKNFIKRPWEQFRLHMIINKYKRHLAIVPHREFTGNMGRHVRHFWNSMDRNKPGTRSDLLRNALVGLVALLQVEADGHV